MGAIGKRLLARGHRHDLGFAVKQFVAPGRRIHRVQRALALLGGNRAQKRGRRNGAIQKALGEGGFVQPFAAQFEPHGNGDVRDQNRAGGDDDQLGGELARPETHQPASSGSTANI